MGLTGHVDTHQISDTRVALRVDRFPTTVGKNKSDMVNIADVGFGVSQVLPAIVGLLTAQKNQLIYIEQPELHLHPKAQIGFVEILANTINRGVRVVIETHSPVILLSVQSLVAEGKISPDRVILHWFSRKEKDGATVISPGELDTSGAFGNWPVDFGEIALGAESRYLDAVEYGLKLTPHG